MLIREEICHFVSICEVCEDTVLWLKISSVNNEDTYICCFYIPPSCSSYYHLYDCDLFSDIEQQISKYSDLGRIFLIGDSNARTGDKNDFISDDTLHNSLNEKLSNLLDYSSDQNELLPTRINPDTEVNDLGYKLINLCKSSGVRIVNGRHPDGYSDSFTFQNRRGMTCIDYLLTRSDTFKFVEKFIVCNFNQFSDHAPLHLQIRLPRQQCEKLGQDASSGSLCAPPPKWNIEKIHEGRLALEQNYQPHLLLSLRYGRKS